MEVMEEEAQELLSFFNHRNVDALLRVTRNTLEMLRKRIHTSSLMHFLGGSWTILCLNTCLMLKHTFEISLYTFPQVFFTGGQKKKSNDCTVCIVSVVTKLSSVLMDRYSVNTTLSGVHLPIIKIAPSHFYCSKAMWAQTPFQQFQIPLIPFSKFYFWLFCPELINCPSFITLYSDVSEFFLLCPHRREWLTRPWQKQWSAGNLQGQRDPLYT